MMMMMSPSFARRAGAAFAATYISLSVVLADVVLNLPLAQQLPPIAHTGTQYNWTLESDTFTYQVPSGQAAPSSPPSIVFAASGMPSWLAFDASTRTFSGTVPDGGSGSKTSVTVNGSVTDAQDISSGNTSATDQFSLLILSAPAPTLAIPISQQLLGAANSLGTANLLPDSVLHIPPGWSFSVGLQWDTFTLTSGNEVYWSANLAGYQPLPSWMDWSADTFDLSGVAPVNVGDGQDFDVVFTGSNRAGYGGTSDTLHIRVSSNTLTVNGSLASVDAAVGVPFQTTISESMLRLDGRPSPESNNVTITANLSTPELSWLSFTSANKTLSGNPPYELYGKANDTTAVQVPLVFSDTLSNHLPANETILIAPYAFTAQQLPNVVVQPGKNFSVDLHSFIRNIGTNGSTVSDTKTAAVIHIVMQTPNVTTAYQPADASSWLTYDNSSMTLSGNVPDNYEQRVQVLLNANGTNTAKGAASFYLSIKGDNPVGNPTGKPNAEPASDGGSHLSKGAKAAIGVVVGLLGLLALILLLCCCLRRRKDRDEEPREKSTTPVVGAAGATDAPNTSGTEGDDHTLTDETALTKMLKAIKMKRSRTPNTPSTLAVTPQPDEKTTPMIGNDSVGSRRGAGAVVVESPNGRRRDASHEAEEPTQHSIFSNLFQGGRAKPPTSTSSKRESHGLGLSLGSAAAVGAAGAAAGHGMHSRSSGRINHQRSRNSVISQRSSWENDLFYEDNGALDSEPIERLNDGSGDGYGDEVPRRRGMGLAEAAPIAAGGAAVAAAFRHRNRHEGTSPAFVAEDGFGQQREHNPFGSNHEEMPNFASDSSLSQGPYDEAYAGLHPDAASEGDPRIMEARLMQVQRHSPMLHQGSDFNFALRSSQHSQDAVVREAPTVYSQEDGEEELGDEHVFDDAEEDRSTHHYHTHPGQFGIDGRNSALSAATATIAHGHTPGRTLLAPAAIDAPHERQRNPSFMDGASITGIDPSESVRRVYPPQTPPRPASAASSSASRHLICPLIPATVGHLVNFHMYPNTPPPMAGAPGSPGKRSGRNVRYELVVEDPRPHLARYRGQWPAMLSDWLSFDQSTFEVVGVVPRGAGLELLGDCEIALVSVSNAAPRPSFGAGSNMLQRPSFERKHTSQTSYDSARSHLEDEGGEIVARARLVFHGSQGQAF